MTTLLLIAIGILAGIAVPAVRAARGRAERQKPQRVVELPNSAYTSKLVRDRDTRLRWAAIPLDRLHEINRGEVERLLERVDTYGIDALRPRDRSFLDALAARTPADTPGRSGSDAGSPLVPGRARTRSASPRTELHPPF